MKLIIIILNLGFLNLTKSIVVPRFDGRDKDGIIFDPILPRAGQPLTAECTVIGLSPENVKSVSWKLKRFNDGKEFFIATDNNVFQFKSPVQRLFAHHELNSNKWSITFNPLDRDDFGNLTCYLADTGDLNVKLTRLLNVHSDPIILESSSKDVDVNVGDEVELVCRAQGYPSPSILWIRADSMPLYDGIIMHMGETIHLRNINENHRGVYKCLATNLIGSGSERTIKVSVRFKPRVKCQTSVGQAPNFEVDAYMECYVYGYPPPRLIWYKVIDLYNPDALIQLNENFKYKFEATIPEPEVCTDCILARITVVNVVASDYGFYVLRATSEHYNDYSSFGRVKLYETPECQQSITNPNNKGCRSPPNFV